MILILELLGAWVLLGVLAVAALNGAKHAVARHARRTA